MSLSLVLSCSNHSSNSSDGMSRARSRTDCSNRSQILARSLSDSFVGMVGSPFVLPGSGRAQIIRPDERAQHRDFCEPFCIEAANPDEGARCCEPGSPKRCAADGGQLAQWVLA